MTESEWLACDNPQRMLAWAVGQGSGSMRADLGDFYGQKPESLRRGLSDRKLRLFACACCRQVWDGAVCEGCTGRGWLDTECDVCGNRSDETGKIEHGRGCYVVDEDGGGSSAADSCEVCEGEGRVGGLTDPRSRRAVEVAERFADGLATKKDMMAAGREATQAWRREEVVTPALLAIWCTHERAGALPHLNWSALIPPATQAALLRDIVGNPWRPSPLITLADPIWREWNNGTVLKLAQAIYEERAFDRMTILADALEDAGCTDADILAHCRGLCPACTDKTGFCWGKVADCRVCHGSGEAGPHVRGCWVLDLLLGKE